MRIVEDGITYEIDVAHGQKTGFYLDQRDNRALFASLAADAEVLNAFCYTGGFTLAALKGGARRALSLDTSEEALASARRNVTLNGFDESRAEWLAADVFAHLRKLRDQNRKFGLIVLDPPKFAPTEKHVAERRARLQGHQPVGDEAARARRAPAHVLVLGRGERGPLRQDRGGSGRRRQGGPAGAPRSWAPRSTTRSRSISPKANTSRGSGCSGT